MKRLFCLFLALLLMLPMLPVPAKAAATSGSCGTGAVWSYDDSTRTLTISVKAGYHTGSVSDYYNDDQPWGAYRGRIQTVIIEEGIDEIGSYVFYEYPVLTTVSLPKTLNHIGHATFNKCTNLKTINFPASLSSIGEWAFGGCKNLTSIVIPSGVTTISRGAFFNCIRLSNVKLHNGITEIGDRAFDNCKALKSITLPNKLTCINESVFSYSGLTSIVIPEGVTIIEKDAFSCCSNLKKVTLPDTIDLIDEDAFYYHKQKITNVYYSGTKADKQEITIGTGNANLKKATWHYKAMPVPAVSGRLSSWNPELTWNAIPNATGYQIFRAAKRDGTYKLVGTTTSTSFIDGNINNWGVKYFYKVRALQGSAKSGFSSIVALRSKLDPAYITVNTAAVSGCPKITWYKVPNATKYTIFRSSSAGGTYTEIGTTTKLNYVDKTAAVGSTYYYKVQACCADSYANADLSNYGSATCVLARPVVKIALKKGDPKLTWKEIGGAHHYEIYRALKKNGNYQQIDTTYDLSYVDSSAKAGKTYFYKVVAVHSNPSFNSAMSAAKSITAK